MRKCILFWSYSIIIISLLTACSGEQGDPGPQGSKGERGGLGIPGANAKTFTFTIRPEDWKASYQDLHRAQYKYTYKTSFLTEKNIKKGAVFAYIKSGEVDTYWRPLPHAITWNTGTHAGDQLITSWEYTYQFRVGEISVYKESYPEQEKDSGLNTIRVVMLEGTPNGRKATVNYKNYEQVRKAYNLPN